MKTATKVVRATGPKSILESIETRAITDIKAAEARINLAMQALETRLGRAEADIMGHAVQIEDVARVQAQHAIKLVEAEAREIDRASMSVLRRIWAWLTHYEGII